MQNLLMAATSIASEGAMYDAFGDARFPMIDARDISEAAAHVLTTPGHEDKTYTLTGPKAITMHDAASALRKALGKPVKYVPIPLQAADEAMAKMGVDEWQRGMMADYFTAFNANWNCTATGDFAAIVGRPPRSIEDFTRDFAGAFRLRPQKVHRRIDPRLKSPVPWSVPPQLEMERALNR